MISIVIVHWRTPSLLKKQLIKLTATPGRWEIIVVNNDTHGSLGWLGDEFPSVRLVQNDINCGYAFACNRGVLFAKGKWLLFLNPDVLIAEEQIKKMLRFAIERRLVACSPKNDQQDYNKPLPSALSLLAEFTPFNKIIPLGVFRKRTLFGGCLLIRADIMRKIGGWDERFFLWFEDSDLTARLDKQNYPIGWLSCPVEHAGGFSFQLLRKQIKRDIFFQSMEVYARKHFSYLGRKIVAIIKKRYTANGLLPGTEDMVSIIVPNLKRELLTDFFRQNSNFVAMIKDFIVVTSALDNAAVWAWRKRYPQVRFILLKKNKGFAATVNVGFRVALGEWVGTVNDDTILPSDWLEKCLLCQRKKVGSLNPVVYKKKDEIESAGIDVLMRGRAIPRKTLPHRVCAKVTAANAAAVVYRKNALNTVGIFDERFGSYLEDIDLSLRLKRGGFVNIVVKESAVFHRQHASRLDLSLKKGFLDFKNWLIVIGKNWSGRALVANFPTIIEERMRNLWGIGKAIISWS